MTFTDRHIIENYFKLFEGLKPTSKMELIEKLAKSLKKEKKFQDDEFFQSFGAFDSEKSAEEIITEIKESRKFRNKDLKI